MLHSTSLWRPQTRVERKVESPNIVCKRIMKIKTTKNPVKSVEQETILQYFSPIMITTIMLPGGNLQPWRMESNIQVKSISPSSLVINIFYLIDMLLPVFFNSSKNTWPFRYCIVVYLYCVDVSTKFLVLIKTKIDLFLHFLL